MMKKTKPLKKTHKLNDGGHKLYEVDSATASQTNQHGSSQYSIL